MTIQTTDVSTRVETVKAIMEASTEDLDFCLPLTTLVV